MKRTSQMVWAAGEANGAAFFAVVDVDRELWNTMQG